MNIDSPEIAAETRPAVLEHDSEATQRTPRSGRAVGWLALLVALTALAAAAWTGWQGLTPVDPAADDLADDVARLVQADARLSGEISNLRDALESSSASGSAGLGSMKQDLAGNASRLDQLQQALQEQEVRSRSLQSALENTHGRLVAAEAALAQVSARELDARGALDLSEVDYLLRLANERLLLFADPVTADRALALADSHLAALDNPVYLGVRQAIATSRRELASVEVPDAAAIATRLDALQAAIPELPVPGDDPPRPPGVVPAPEGWWAKLKATLASLVTVRRSTIDTDARLSLADEDYLRQRLWLQLDVARLAAMRRDSGAFTDALDRVRGTVDQWFDGASVAGRAFLADLDALAGLNIAAEWPDISAPWQAMRLVRSAPTAPAAPPQPAGETARDESAPPTAATDGGE